MAGAKKNIIAKDFFCIKEKKNYKKGNEYKGKRKDLGDLLVTKADYDAEQKKRAEHNAKIAEADKKRVDKIGQFGKAKHIQENKKK